MSRQSVIKQAATLALKREGWKLLYDRMVWSLPADLSIRLERKHPAEVVATLAELDAYLMRAEKLFYESEDLAREFLASFELAAPPLPSDPFSLEYRDAQWALYEHVSGRDGYHIGNEESIFDLDEAVRCPFPYDTGSPGVVGDQLVAAGHILKNLPVEPPARVVEFGAGWGNVSLSLAAMGYDLTLVEVGENFGELLGARTRDMPNVRVIVQDMLDFEPDGLYDVALFYESFHHCSDHLAMLARLHDVVGPNGTIVFAAEPIRRFPYPWGLRLDGMSLWSTRRHGWLELGFDSSYFAAALARTGWEHRRRIARAASPLADVIIARQRPPT